MKAVIVLLLLFNGAVSFSLQKPSRLLSFSRILFSSSASVDVVSQPVAAPIKELSNTTVSTSKAGTRKEAAGKRVKKVKPVHISRKEQTGLKYSDEFGSYDVPIHRDFRWYLFTVRRNSERRMCESLLKLADLDSKWKGVFNATYYKQSPYIRFKGNVLEVTSKPMVPGVIYAKMRMDPDIADVLHSLYSTTFL